jgi:hypothetical protein
LFVVVVLVERGQQNQFNPRGRQCSRTLLTVDEMIEMREFYVAGQETVTRTSFQGKPGKGKPGKGMTTNEIVRWPKSYPHLESRPAIMADAEAEAIHAAELKKRRQFRKYSYRGVDLEDLLDKSSEEIPSPNCSA